MNVIPAWQAGYAGKDIVVTILDDGIEKDHPDLSENYVCRVACTLYSQIQYRPIISDSSAQLEYVHVIAAVLSIYLSTYKLLIIIDISVLLFIPPPRSYSVFRNSYPPEATIFGVQLLLRRFSSNCRFRAAH